MKRLITICIVLTAIALLSAPLFAEVQNVKVSGDVDTNAVYREDYNLLNTPAQSGTAATHNNFLMTQARVRVDADLTDNVATTVRLLTEYDWDTADNTTGDGDNVDLDLANVTLKEVFYAPLSVTVGRQELKYGNAFVIGDPDTNATSADGNITARDLSLRKSFDAIKAVIDYEPLVVDLIYSKIDETNATKTDQDLYGINAAYDIGSYNSEIEAYWFMFTRDTAAAMTPAVSNTRPGHEISTFGLRGSVEPIEKLNLLGEIAWQKGEYDSESNTTRNQDALAYQIGGDYAFSDIQIPGVGITIVSPMLKLGWTHYSGEEFANTGDHEAWIPLFEDQTHGVAANYILGGVNGGQNSNADILNVGGSIVPLEDLTVSLDFYKFWLDEKLVAETNQQASQGTSLGWTNLTETSYYMRADDDLGFELDLGLNYDYTEDVKMGLSAGWFSAGDAFNGSSGDMENNETAIQVLATLDVAF